MRNGTDERQRLQAARAYKRCGLIIHEMQFDRFRAFFCVIAHSRQAAARNVRQQGMREETGD
jgi:hypothetical protein